MRHQTDLLFSGDRGRQLWTGIPAVSYDVPDALLNVRTDDESASRERPQKFSGILQCIRSDGPRHLASHAARADSVKPREPEHCAVIPTRWAKRASIRRPA